jgi:hypothetical protein
MLVLTLFIKFFGAGDNSSRIFFGCEGQYFGSLGFLLGDQLTDNYTLSGVRDFNSLFINMLVFSDTKDLSTSQSDFSRGKVSGHLDLTFPESF